jgi:hypothetical protein
VERVFSEEMARRLLQAMNEQQATGRTDVDVFPAAVGHLEEEDYIDPSPNATLVGAIVFRITDKGMAWLETPPPEV